MKILNPTKPKFPIIVSDQTELLSVIKRLHSLGYHWNNQIAGEKWRIDFKKSWYPLEFRLKEEFTVSIHKI